VTDKPLEPYGKDVTDAAVWNEELERLSKVEIINLKI
jgi:hypothetical protein